MSNDSTISARALASRRNGARSRGPRSAAGKARVSRNALKHGLAARHLVLLDDEDYVRFAAFEAAIRAELVPTGALEADIVARIVAAARRARRADRMGMALMNLWMSDVPFTDELKRQVEFCLRADARRPWPACAPDLNTLR